MRRKTRAAPMTPPAGGRRPRPDRGAQPAGREATRTNSGQDRVDGGLVGLGGRGAEGQGDGAKAQVEQAVADPRLQVVVAGLGVARARISICRSLRPKRRVGLGALRLQGPGLGRKIRVGQLSMIGRRRSGFGRRRPATGWRRSPRRSSCAGSSATRAAARRRPGHRAPASPRRRGSGSAGRPGAGRCDGRDRPAPPARRRCAPGPRSRRPGRGVAQRLASAVEQPAMNGPPSKGRAGGLERRAGQQGDQARERALGRPARRPGFPAPTTGGRARPG
jgi:hypothetical protein